MSEDKHENNARTTGNKVNKDALMNLLNNLAKSDYTIDMNTMMRAASNLVNDDSPVNTSHDHGDFQQNSTQTPTFQPEYQRKSDFTLLSEQLENLANSISALRDELAGLKDQNKKLIENLANGISALRDELAGLKDQNKKLIEQVSGLGKSNKKKK
ncbi:hypothetical protein [Neobacillus soli]|uniref:hypothetical protein n=1 Tax=Neobacillus soli TaxID=220688 RepID=UPI00082471CE|nr:hypothetical protein [Neobacillus soli]